MDREAVLADIRSVELALRGRFVLASGHAITQLNLTVPQLRLLLVLDGGVTMSANEVADLLRVASSTVTSSVDRLVRRGMISRVEDPEDRRRKRLSLTPEGAAALESINRNGLSGLMAALGGLSDAELVDFRRLIRRLWEEAEQIGDWRD